MKIAHISDLHICSKCRHTNLGKAKFLLKYFIKNNYDHIVITGDLTDNADEKDFENFAVLLRSLNLMDSSKVTLILGNHDVYGGVHSADDIITFPKRCKETNYNERVNIFTNYFSDLYEGAYKPSENIYPFSKDLGDVVLLGINSNDEYSKYKNPFSSNGKVYKEQLDAVEKILTKDEYRNKKFVVLIHHHFYSGFLKDTSDGGKIWEKIENYTMKFRGYDKLIKLFSDYNVKAVLHGHVHENINYTKNGVLFCNAGKSLNSRISNTFHFNHLEIEDNNIFAKTTTLKRSKKKEQASYVKPRYNIYLETV